MGSFSIFHWVIVLVIVVLLFGTKKLGGVGADLGRAVKGFKDGIREEKNNADSLLPVKQGMEEASEKVIEK